MDVNRTLAEATRRYLAAEITLPELADISASHVHLLPSLPLESLAGRLIGAIEQGLAFMNDDVATKDDLRRVLQSELSAPVAATDLCVVDYADSAAAAPTP